MSFFDVRLVGVEVRPGRECGASITWMAAGEASVDICSLLGLAMVCVVPAGGGAGKGWGGRFGWTLFITSGTRGRGEGGLVQKANVKWNKVG